MVIVQLGIHLAMRIQWTVPDRANCHLPEAVRPVSTYRGGKLCIC